MLHLLRREPDIGECRVCDGGEEAPAEVAAFAPHLVFLDVQMPEVDGFEVVRRVGPERMPPLVFVTAHDEFALRAFDVNAVDYLLKPVSDERFAVAMRRARARMAGEVAAALSHQLSGLLRHVGDRRGAQAEAPRAVHSSRIVIREGTRTVVIEVDDIEYVEAEDYCIAILAGGRSHLVRETLASFAAQLDPRRFVRVHRSAVVNIDHAVMVRALPSGRIELELKSGKTLPVSRSRARALQDALGASR